MKGLGRPRNIKQIFANYLADMIGESNAMFSKDNTGTMGYKTSWNPGRFRSSSGSRKNSPGRKRKLGANRFMTPAPPNPERRATKSLNGHIFHGFSPRGHMVKAPTLDQTAALTQRIGCKVVVRDGECFIRILGSILGRGPILIDCTRNTFMKMMGITSTVTGRA